jgi:exopolyphosphatase/guanosine-5'-triphosphate,3'-diphosphate pyrophosphatase
MPVFAAVDIGSNSVRLSIAELRRGHLVALHQDREVTRLGEGVFRDGDLDPQAMAQTLKVMRRFHRAVQSFAVERTRVVGTSALRDCNNARLFAEWIKTATGWHLEVITGLEEGRLIHLGVISSLRTPPPKLLLLDLGGGSCELTLSEKGHIKEIVSLPLGAVRLTQEFIHHDPPNKADLKRLHEFIVQEVANVSRKITRAAVPMVIATSGTAAARLAKLTDRQRAAIKGINSKRAQIIVAGAAVYAHVLHACGLKGFRYSPLGLRDGILAQMSAEYDQHTRSHRQLKADRQDVLLNTSKRYGVDLENAEQVSKLALELFDQLKSVHGLSKECREWIDAAAMLYEVGIYINPVGLHRHAYYVISRSELYGFTPMQRKIIATIARFQGNSKPQLRDRLIKLLPAQIRSDVIKATAILRVARALNQGRRSSVESIRAIARGGDVTLAVNAGRGGADLELWAGEKERVYFRAVFGRELIFKLV